MTIGQTRLIKSLLRLRLKLQIVTVSLPTALLTRTPQTMKWPRRQRLCPWRTDVAPGTLMCVTYFRSKCLRLARQVVKDAIRPECAKSTTPFSRSSSSKVPTGARLRSGRWPTSYRSLMSRSTSGTGNEKRKSLVIRIAPHRPAPRRQGMTLLRPQALRTHSEPSPCPFNLEILSQALIGRLFTAFAVYVSSEAIYRTD